MDLAGQLDLPGDGEPRAFAVFAHCFTGTKNLTSAVTICRALCDEGFGVLRFDFTGLGDSEGDFSDTNFSSNISDITSVARFLASRWRPPAVLVGHSLGGTATLGAARTVASCRAVATIGSPADPEHVLALLSDEREVIERTGQAMVNLAGRRFCIKKQLIDDLEDQNWRQSITDLTQALLIMHAPGDAIVHIDNAALIYRLARHPKSFLSLDDADHLLSRAADARYAGIVLAAWASRYI